MVKFILAVLRYFGINAVVVPNYGDAEIASIKELIAEVESKNASGEYKRDRVLKGMRNRFPDASVSELSLLVELVLCGAVS